MKVTDHKNKNPLVYYIICPFIVKQVSWFKLSLLLRIQIKYTHELQFLIKTKDSIFNRKIYTTDERRRPGLAWVSETNSILIKEKHQWLSKMSDRVPRNVFGAQVLEV